MIFHINDISHGLKNDISHIDNVINDISHIWMIFHIFLL
eukprot:UN11107